MRGKKGNSKRLKESSKAQPGQEAVVWQHNTLAEARYELTAREQKLLLYVIAMIEQEDADFKRYVVNIQEFAQLAGLQKDDLYSELRDLAKSLKQKPLIIPNHFDEQTGTYLAVVTNWFDTAYVGRNGAGYFAVTFSPVLKPYLLQVKREFFAIEREEGTKTFDVPLWDPARASTTAILRACYSTWETLDGLGKSPGTVHEDDLVCALARAGLAEKTAQTCARLCWDVDWSAKNPLSAWLKAVRSFYLPKLPSV